MVVIDFHVHVEKPRTCERFSRDEIIQSMDESGIDYSVLLAIAKKGDLEKTKKQNDWLASFCQQESRFVGFGSVHPADGEEALKEMSRCIDELGLRGFKFHPFVQGFDSGDPEIIDILKCAAELAVPVVIDSYNPLDGTQSAKLLHAVASSPKTKLCMAHVGLYRFMEFNIFGFLRKNPPFESNVYFDLTSACLIFLNSPFQEQFRWVTEQLGSDRLLLGSDFPGNSMKESLEAVTEFGYKDDWLPKILGENAAKLLKL